MPHRLGAAEDTTARRIPALEGLLRGVMRRPLPRHSSLPFSAGLAQAAVGDGAVLRPVDGDGGGADEPEAEVVLSTSSAAGRAGQGGVLESLVADGQPAERVGIEARGGDEMALVVGGTVGAFEGREVTADDLQLTGCAVAPDGDHRYRETIHRGEARDGMIEALPTDRAILSAVLARRRPPPLEQPGQPSCHDGCPEEPVASPTIVAGCRLRHPLGRVATRRRACALRSDRNPRPPPPW